LAAHRFSPADRGNQYYLGLRAVGVLNYEDEWLTGERRFLTQYLGHYPDALIFDVGANEGKYARIVRSISAEASIHCFEPHPTSFTRLVKTSETCRLTPHQLALGEKPGEVELFDYADDPGSEHASLYKQVIEDLHRRPAEVHKVACETVDRIAERLGVTQIGLLKIDTEGHEMAVLMGASRLLKRGGIDFIQFEFNEMNVFSRVFMRDFFDLLPGYTFHRLLPETAIKLASYDPVFMEVFAYQNLVCVRKGLDAHWLTSHSTFPPR
jgi:FkbM family methyltransferase